MSGDHPTRLRGRCGVLGIGPRFAAWLASRLQHAGGGPSPRRALRGYPATGAPSRRVASSDTLVGRVRRRSVETGRGTGAAGSRGPLAVRGLRRVGVSPTARLGAPLSASTPFHPPRRPEPRPSPRPPVFHLGDGRDRGGLRVPRSRRQRPPPNPDRRGGSCVFRRRFTRPRSSRSARHRRNRCRRSSRQTAYTACRCPSCSRSS